MNKQLKLSMYFVMLVSLISPSFALEFEIDSKNNAIKASGTIEPYDTEKLKKFFSKHSLKKPTYISLDISGGKVEESIILGNYFREHKIPTVIQPFVACTSACVYAFWGGTDSSGKKSMTMNTYSIVGLHALSNKKNREPASMPSDMSKENEDITRYTQQAVAAILEYSQTVNIPIEILIKIFSTPSDKLYCITSKEAQAYGIKIEDNNKNNTKDKVWNKKISDVCINK